LQKLQKTMKKILQNHQLAYISQKLLKVIIMLWFNFLLPFLQCISHSKTATNWIST
jgi:hypothetical protein